jgi:RNA polymerase sigma-70 factor (ECF subfamily)
VGDFVTDSAPAPRDLLGRHEPFDFDAAFRTHFAYVWNSLRRLGVRDADLEDLTHDVFVALHKKREAFDVTRPMKPWLFAIAANVASDYRRKASHRREHIGDTLETPDRTPGADAMLEHQEKQQLVQRAIASIEEGRVAVFLMHDLDGIAMPDVAVALGIPLNTGYSRLRLARADFEASIRRLRAQRGSQP